MMTPYPVLAAEVTTVEVEITKDDCTHGERNQCSNCMIARGIKRRLPKARHVRVLPDFRGSGEVELAGEWARNFTTSALDPAANAAAMWFDDPDLYPASEPKFPFTFTLEVPVELL